MSHRRADDAADRSATEGADPRAFLARAQEIRRGAARGLQKGLQPAEERQAEGREPTTLHRALARRRHAERVMPTAQQLGRTIQRQQDSLDRLSRFGPTVRNAVGEGLTAEAMSEPFTIDNKPPVITALDAKGEPGAIAVSGHASDGQSILVRLEVEVDDGDWRMLTPSGLCPCGMA